MVIAILGILAAIAIPRLSGIRGNAAERADAATIRTIQSAISIAEADGNLTLLHTIIPPATTAAAPTQAIIEAAIVPRYLAVLPVAQSNTSGNWTWTIDGGSTTEPCTVVIVPAS